LRGSFCADVRLPRRGCKTFAIVRTKVVFRTYAIGIQLTGANSKRKNARMATKKLHTALASFIFLAAIVSPAAQDMSLETQLLDAMSKLSGVHPGFPANHATGIVVAGSFEATPHAAQLSKAVLFSGLKIPATARFSDVPNIEDGSAFANPWHGDRIPSYPKPTSSSTRSNSFRYPALQISVMCCLQRLRAHQRLRNRQRSSNSSRPIRLCSLR
jgi:hypothetical protein